MRKVFYGFLGLFLLFPWVHAQESANDPHAGKYELVQPPQPTSDPNKVEVLEFFWYVCPHCYAFEKFLRSKSWLENKPDDVAFIHMPAVFENDKWTPLAKAYYPADALGVLDKVHVPLFQAIHDQRKHINNKEAIGKIFVEKGVKKEDFDATFDSFAVESKVNRAKDMTPRYGITGVPVVIVNGKYRLTSEKADGYENMLLILNYLIEKERYIMKANQEMQQDDKKNK